MKQNLVVGVLGHRNSGKSSTWYELFEESVKTGKYIRRLYLTETEYIEVFLIGGSSEERGLHIGEIVGNQSPRIVLCSMQYGPAVSTTIDFFQERDYSFYIQWLNPGFHDQGEMGYFDYLGLMHRLLSLDSIVSIRNAKTNITSRVAEISEYLYSWAKFRNLLLSE